MVPPFALVPVKIFMRTIPDGIHARVFAALFNHALRGQNIASRFVEVEGKSILLHVKDVPSWLHFRFERDGLTYNPDGRPDVVIAGDLGNFLKLARRDEDPDTLFFTRQLNIEGETETGLHVKNLLDSLEFDLDVHIDTVLPPRLAEIARRFVHLVR